MKKQKSLALAALISSLLIFGGCNDKEAEGRKVIKNENKTITVIKDTKDVLGDEIVVSKIDRYEDLVGWDWFDDENSMLSKTSVREANLCSYELSSEKEVVIPLESEFVFSYALLSEDKNHILRFRNYPKSIIFTDIAGNIKTEVEIDFRLDISLAKWVNQEEVIIPYIIGESFCVVNIDGTKSEVVVTEDSLNTEGIIKLLGKVNNKVYYISEDEEFNTLLLVYDLELKDKIVLLGDEDFKDCKLSQDKKKLVLYKLNKRDKAHEIILMNLDGTKRETIVTSPHTIFSYELSPDGTKLVYWYRENTNNIDIIEVIDLKTNKKSQIFSGQVGYKQYIFENVLKWSPSGEKILVNTKKTNNRKSEYFINVITIK